MARRTHTPILEICSSDTFKNNSTSLHFSKLNDALAAKLEILKLFNTKTCSNKQLSRYNSSSLTLNNNLIVLPGLFI